MSFGDDAIRSLRDALQFSPENVPLRLHLAASLMGLGRLDEAEREYRDALRGPATISMRGSAWQNATGGRANRRRRW